MNVTVCAKIRPSQSKKLGGVRQMCGNPHAHDGECGSWILVSQPEHAVAMRTHTIKLVELEERNVPTLETILTEIRSERTHQDKKWGTKFDDANTINDWAAYANIYLSNATTMKASREEQREGILQAASLLIAALEAFDRNRGFPARHYDKK